MTPCLLLVMAAPVQIGQHGVPGTHFFEQVAPQGIQIFHFEHPFFRFEGDPGVLLELRFQLPLTPAGVTDKCPDGKALQLG